MVQHHADMNNEFFIELYQTNKRKSLLLGVRPSNILINLALTMVKIMDALVSNDMKFVGIDNAEIYDDR